MFVFCLSGLPTLKVRSHHYNNAEPNQSTFLTGKLQGLYQFKEAAQMNLDEGDSAFVFMSRHSLLLAVTFCPLAFFLLAEVQAIPIASGSISLRDSGSWRRTKRGPSMLKSEGRF